MQYDLTQPCLLRHSDMETSAVAWASDGQRQPAGHDDGNSWQPASFWSAADGAVLCGLCPFRCRFEVDGPGRCRVRRRSGLGVQTATRRVALCNRQPIERKQLYHFRPGAETLAIAAPGCSFRCDFCQNATFAQSGSDGCPGQAEDAGLDAATVAALVKGGGDREGEEDGGEENGPAVVALSHSEPVLAAELTLALHELGVPRDRLVWKSNGFITPEALARVAPVLGAVNIDLKCADPDIHERITGAPLAPVLESLHGFAAAGVWVEVSTPIIPGVNDDPAEIRALAGRVAALGRDTPWHLRRFRPPHHRLETMPTPISTLGAVVAVARAAGLRHVYCDRLPAAEALTTSCPGCCRPVITRSLEGSLCRALWNGACAACGAPVAGFFPD